MNKEMKKHQRILVVHHPWPPLVPDSSHRLLKFRKSVIATHQKQYKPDLCGILKALIEVSKVIRQETRKYCCLLKKQATDLLKNKNIGIITLCFLQITQHPQKGCLVLWRPSQIKRGILATFPLLYFHSLFFQFHSKIHCSFNIHTTI